MVADPKGVLDADKFNNGAVDSVGIYSKYPITLGITHPSIALQLGSELREQINQTTLEMFTDGTYHRLLSEYTGQTP